MVDFGGYVRRHEARFDYRPIADGDGMYMVRTTTKEEADALHGNLAMFIMDKPEFRVLLPRFVEERKKLTNDRCLLDDAVRIWDGWTSRCIGNGLLGVKGHCAEVTQLREFFGVGPKTIITDEYEEREVWPEVRAGHLLAEHLKGFIENWGVHFETDGFKHGNEKTVFRCSNCGSVVMLVDMVWNNHDEDICPICGDEEGGIIVNHYAGDAKINLEV
jgi:hypothetical protein